MKKVKVEVEKIKTSDGVLFDLHDERRAKIHEQSISDETIIACKDGHYYKMTEEYPDDGDWFYHTGQQIVGKVERIYNNTIRTCAYPLHSYQLSHYTKKLIRLI